MPESKTELCGYLPIDKPADFSSHDAVAIARKALGIKRIGHTGTLDPFATGLLILLIGEAARLQDLFMGSDKVYEADFNLQNSTDSADSTGTLLSSSDTQILSSITIKDLQKAAEGFAGKIKQKPPSFSAVHIDGKRAYDLARAGKNPEMPEREVLVHSFEILSYSMPVVKVKIHCGGGTYIRSIARDFAISLNLQGHCSALRRISAGSINVKDAAVLKEITADNILSVENYLKNIPQIAWYDCSEAQISDVKMGRLSPYLKGSENLAAICRNSIVQAMVDRRSGRLVFNRK